MPGNFITRKGEVSCYLCGPFSVKQISLPWPNKDALSEQELIKGFASVRFDTFYDFKDAISALSCVYVSKLVNGSVERKSIKYVKV